MRKQPEKTTEVAPSTDKLSRTLPPFQANLYGGLGGPARDRNFEAYSEMLRVDYQAQQAVRFSTNIIANLIGDYQHPDEQITEFVQAALKDMGGTWNQNLRWLLRARIYGFSLAEKVWKQQRIAGRQAWNFAQLAPISPESVAHRGLVFDNVTGELREVIQWRQYGEGIHIPAEKVVHWPHEDLGDGYGTPLGETMLPLYRAKRSSMEAWQVAAKYRGMPQIVVVVADGKYQDPASKREISTTELMGNIWAEVKSAGVVVMGTPTGETADSNLPRVEQLQGEAFGDEFSAHIRWVDGAYLTAVGVPALVQLEGQFGTRAQSAVHSDAAKFGALPVAEEFAETCLIEQIVKPLLDVNYGEQEDYGSFPASIPVDEEFVANILTALNTAGFLGMMVDERVYRHWQERLPQYLPEIDGGDYEQEQPAQPTLPMEVPADEASVSPVAQ